MKRLPYYSMRIESQQRQIKAYNELIEEVDQVNHEVDMVVSQMKELQQHLIKTCDGLHKEFEERNQEASEFVVEKDAAATGSSSSSK